MLLTTMQDSSRARIGKGCLPYISLVPTTVAVLALAVLCLRPFLKWRPSWLKNFAAESAKGADDLTSKIIKRWTHWTALLIITTIIGTLLSIVSTALYVEEAWAVLFVLPWV